MSRASLPPATPPLTGFDHVTDWVFDLDNTLYPPEAALFSQIEVKMADYVMRLLDVDLARANHLRSHYWQLYGTTLAGLMHEHGIDPLPFLRDVHDISFDGLTADPALAEGIRALRGRKIVYTNGSAPYAEQVLKARGLSGLFDGVYGVEDADFQPKPRAEAFDMVFAKAGISPANGAMFEDDPRNLLVPHQRGMATIHVAPAALAADHIQHHTSDLSGFLTRLTRES